MNDAQKISLKPRLAFMGEHGVGRQYRHQDIFVEILDACKTRVLHCSKLPSDDEEERHFVIHHFIISMLYYVDRVLSHLGTPHILLT